MRLLVTGAAGFIGTNFVRFVLGEGAARALRVERLVAVDLLTYAGNYANLADLGGEVDHDVDALSAHERRDRPACGDIEPHEVEPRIAFEIGEVRVVAGVRQQVERDEALDVVAAEGVADEVRADEAGGASDEEPHRQRFFVRQSKPMRGSSNGMRSSSGASGS